MSIDSNTIRIMQAIETKTPLNLEPYSVQEEYHPRDWVFAILFRSAGQRFPEKENVKECFQYSPLDVNDLRHVISFRKIAFGKVTKRLNVDPVSNISWGNLLSLVMLEDIKDELASHIEKTKGGESTKEHFSSFEKKVKKLTEIISDSEHDEVHERIVSVDISLPREVLITHFTEWLKHTQSRHRHPHYHKGCAAFKKWINYRLLPYIDLICVAKMMNVNLTKKDVINILYPDMGYDPDNIRNTIEKQAKILVSPSTVGALYKYDG